MLALKVIMVLGSWRHLKKSLPNAVRQGQYAGYLCEHLWRKSHREEDLFKAFVENIAMVHAPVCHD